MTPRPAARDALRRHAAGLARLIALSLTLALGAACGSSHPADPTTDSGTPVAVQIAMADARATPAAIEIGGLVQPRNGAVITSRLMAPVRDVRVSPGDRVREGQVLVTLDDRDLQAQARRAATGAVAAREGRAALDAQRQAAVAALDLARASHGRIAALHARKSATAQELDDATASLRGAEAGLTAVEARSREADAAITSATAGRDAAAVSASFATITAPFAGIVTEKLIEPGNMAMPGTPLLRLEDTRGYTLDLQVDAALVPGVEQGAAIDVVVDADRPLTLTGHVRDIARAMDADGRAFLVRLDLPAAPALRAGMFGRATLHGAATDAITVPASAVQRTGQVASVFVVDAAVARRRLIVTGAALGDRIEVLSGLDAGERVVVDPPLSLSDGAAIKDGGPR